MRRKPLHYAAICFVTSLAVIACATQAPPPPEAVLSITGANCTPTIDATAPISLTPEKKKTVFFESTTFDSITPCVQEEGKEPEKYALYKLPDFASNHVITIGGAREGKRTLATAVSLLDDNMLVTRRFGQEKYSIRGNTHAVQFRPREDERYILVTTDSTLVGESHRELKQSIHAKQNTAFSPANPSVSNSPATYSNYTTYHGVENTYNRTFSFEGNVFVRVQALSGKIAAPERP